MVLRFAGETAVGIITSVRRVGGERDEVIPGRYTYDIGYTFTLPSGKKVDGFTKRVGDSVYVKPTGKDIVTVRYLALAPFVNALERDTGVGAGQLALVAVGVVLILLVNK